MPQTENNSKTTWKRFPYFNIDRFWGLPNCLAAMLFSLPVTFIVQVVLSFIPENGLLAELVGNVNEEWYMNTYFSLRNSSPKECPDSTIYIIDIKDDYSSRSDIAEVVWALAAHRPKLICLDMTFSKGQSYDKKMSQHLLDTLSMVRQATPLVAVSYKGNENEVRHSYFTDTLNLEYGLSDFLGFHHFVPSIDNHPRISAKVAQMVGMNLDLLPSDILVNYREKVFAHMPIFEKEDLAHLPDLKDKIVLLGQRNTPDDMHATPFLIDQKRQIPGIDIVAYEVSSLLADEKSPDYRFFRYYQLCGTGQNLFLFMLMSLLFFLPYHFIRKILNKHQIWLQWGKFILLIIAEYFIINACFCYTDWYFQIPNFVLFMLTTLLAEPIYETIYYLTHKFNNAL